MVSQAFTDAASRVKDLATSPDNNNLLELYSLYKQATIGDCTVARPTGLLNAKEKAKWDAWKGKEGLSKEDAEKQYIALVEKLSQ
ncbi:Acyl-CoA-binding domain-containing protein 7 [Mortierella polycephala]|uniref:Acyl-CoA-binding domain-containing protein 7 n=1 Tax=Mortierella polycephala TaxID=41804 RepID=A0A9P6TW75_9FUNG|nr:Acyl-CoA-binding domain-containing protein 7 [Mortierella polycephala]